MKIRSPIVFGAVFLLALSACGDDGPTAPGNRGHQAIATGSWSATAGFGSFDFIVNNGMSITEISYTFESFSCGGVTISGSVTVTSGSGWPITRRSFEIVNDLSTGGDTQEMTISGEFADNGREASGSYSADWRGTVCEGSWEGSV